MKFTGTKNYVSTEDLSMAVNATIALERPLINCYSLDQLKLHSSH